MTGCPAFLISAPASGQGKTSVTAAIARSARRRGLRVRVFKTGPDYLDPMVLARASGHTVYQLDLFMGGEAHCRQLLDDASRDADLILVEGVMGLFDGKPSSADLAAAFDLPVLVVLDASAMAQTFAALATGLARFRDDIVVAGVIANHVGNDAHARMVAEGLPKELPLIAALKRNGDLSLPERHLGLVQALELPELDAQLDAWADAWDVGAGLGVSEAGDRVPLFGTQGRNLLAGRQAKGGDGKKGGPVDGLALDRRLEGCRIAVASDACFSFIYPANLDLLRALGADVREFSPIAGEDLPGCDALWLPGGYPELHAEALRAHPRFFADLKAHLEAQRPSPGPRVSCAATPSITPRRTRRSRRSPLRAIPMPAAPPRRSMRAARCARATSITTFRRTLPPSRRSSAASPPPNPFPGTESRPCCSNPASPISRRPCCGPC